MVCAVANLGASSVRCGPNFIKGEGQIRRLEKEEGGRVRDAQKTFITGDDKDSGISDLSMQRAIPITALHVVKKTNSGECPNFLTNDGQSEGCMLITGDHEGNVAVWDLQSAIAGIEIVPEDKLPMMQEGYNPHRHIFTNVVEPTAKRASVQRKQRRRRDNTADELMGDEIKLPPLQIMPERRRRQQEKSSSINDAKSKTGRKRQLAAERARGRRRSITFLHGHDSLLALASSDPAPPLSGNDDAGIGRTAMVCLGMWQAHSEDVTSLEFIGPDREATTASILSTSNDGSVRIHALGHEFEAALTAEVNESMSRRQPEYNRELATKTALETAAAAAAAAAADAAVEAAAAAADAAASSGRVCLADEVEDEGVAGQLKESGGAGTSTMEGQNDAKGNGNVDQKKSSSTYEARLYSTGIEPHHQRRGGLLWNGKRLMGEPLGCLTLPDEVHTAIKAGLQQATPWMFVLDTRLRSARRTEEAQEVLDSLPQIKKRLECSDPATAVVLKASGCDSEKRNGPPGKRMRRPTTLRTGASLAVELALHESRSNPVLETQPVLRNAIPGRSSKAPRTAIMSPMRNAYRHMHCERSRAIKRFAGAAHATARLSNERVDVTPSAFLRSKLKFDHRSGKLESSEAWRRRRQRNGLRGTKRSAEVEGGRWVAPWERQGRLIAGRISNRGVDRRSSSRLEHSASVPALRPSMGVARESGRPNAIANKFGPVAIERPVRMRKRQQSATERADSLLAKIESLASGRSANVSAAPDGLKNNTNGVGPRMSTGGPFQDERPKLGISPIKVSIGRGSVEVRTFSLGDGAEVSKVGSGKPGDVMPSGGDQQATRWHGAKTPSLRMTMSMKLASRRLRTHRREAAGSKRFTRIELIELKALFDDLCRENVQSKTAAVTTEKLLAHFARSENALAASFVAVFGSLNEEKSRKIEAACFVEMLGCFMPSASRLELQNAHRVIKSATAMETMLNAEELALESQLLSIATMQVGEPPNHKVHLKHPDLLELLLLPAWKEAGGGGGTLGPGVDESCFFGRAKILFDTAAVTSSPSSHPVSLRTHGSDGVGGTGIGTSVNSQDRKGEVKHAVSAATLKARRRRKAGMGQHGQAVTLRDCFGSTTAAKREVLALKRQFDSIDTDGSGMIDMVELFHNIERETIKRERGSEQRKDKRGKAILQEAAAMFENMDRNRSGDVSFKEMLRAFMPAISAVELKQLEAFAKSKGNDRLPPRRSLTEEERIEIEALFRMYDVDGSQTISVSELFEALNHRKFDPDRSYVDLAFTAEELRVLCERYDIDDNEELDMAEFSELLHDILCADQTDPDRARRRREAIGF